MAPREILGGAIDLKWEKFVADSITLVVGTSSGSVTDLQVAHDGNIYNLVEAAATPAQDLIIDFIDVPVFHYVRILSNYLGGATHFVNTQLFNWVTNTWDKWDANSNENTIENHSFFAQEHTDYVGKGVDSGRVRVRFLHPIAGNVSHDSFIDEVSLFRVT